MVKIPMPERLDRWMHKKGIEKNPYIQPAQWSLEIHIDWIWRAAKYKRCFGNLLAFILKHPVLWAKLKLLHPSCKYPLIISIMEGDLTERALEDLRMTF